MNAASFAVDGAPHAAIAQGSLFTVFGVDVGPAEAMRADAFPLPLDLGGVSIKVSAGGQEFDAVVLFAVSTQVSAILPSNVPIGQASLVLTYNKEVSNAITFPVVASQAGVFSRSQTGTGVAVIQNYISPDNQPTNSVNQAAQPGQIAILWTTGLGASLNADDRNLPAPGDVIARDAIQVYVGGHQATVEYAGRSGCCAGVDQINFVVPAEVSGCTLPVVVVTNGAASNFTAMSVSSDGTVCDDPGGLSRSQVETLVSGDTIRTGVVSLSKVRSHVTIPVLGDFVADGDLGNASFHEFQTTGLLDSIGLGGSPVFGAGSCMVTTLRGGSSPEGSPQGHSFEDQYKLRALDAGDGITVSGPNGARELEKVDDRPGDYFGLFTDGATPGDSYLDPGDYSLNNGSGGADVGGFHIARSVPSFLEWTSRESITTVDRSQPFTVTWTPSSTEGGVAAIFGTSASVPKQVTSVLFCFADLATGQFTIPEHVLGAMVESDTGPGVDAPGGSMSVGGYSDMAPFEADGLDLGVFFISVMEQHLMKYQ